MTHPEHTITPDGVERLCALCSAPSDIHCHSTYLGHLIVKSKSLVTLTTHWHSGEMGAKTLVELKERIRALEMSESR